MLSVDGERLGFFFGEMDNHTWLNKCTSKWHSTLIPSMASSSSQVQPQESRNHLDMNTGPYLYPHMIQDPRSTARGRVREPTLPNPLNLCSYKSDDAGVGNSYSAVLTGPPSLLQCNIQQLSNPKPFDTSSKLPINSVVGSGVSLTRIGPVSETRGNQNQRNGADFSQVVSSNAAVSINCNSTIGLNNNLPAACFNLQRSDMGMAKAARDISFSRGEWDSSANFANSGKLHLTNFEASQKISNERNSFISNQSSTSLSGCPRVFCLSLSGDLLLSNTGLLGVVCSCHCLHMSISKFCEHSGLYDVNPGDAVRMDSGETIARWRKLYFQKFGIRVLEDQNGWDWPECYSTTAGLVKPSSTVPSISKDFDMYRLVGSCGGSVRSGQPPDNLLSSENSFPDQNHLNDILRNKQLRNAQDSCNFLFKGFTGASQSNLHVEDNHLPRCSTMSKFMGRGGPDNDCQSISAYIDSISSSGNSFMSKPTLQNLRILGANSDVREASNLKEAVIVDRDAVSSNIELRLGQPYQQSWNLGNTLLSVRPKPLDKLGDQQKSVSHDHLIHKHNFKVAGKCSQYPPCVSGTPDITTMREQNQSNFISYSSGANNELDTAKFEQCKGDPTKSSVISMLLSHINALSEGNGHSRANHNIANDNVHSMRSRTLPCESHIAQCNCAPIKYPWNSCDGLGRNSSIKASGLLNRHMDEGKGVRCVAGSSYSAAESYYEIPKRMDSSQILNGVVGGSSNPRNTAVHDRDLYSCQFSGMPMDASSDAINFLNDSGKVLSSGNSGQNNNVFIRSLSSAVSAGIISPPQAASILNSSATSTSTSNLTSALQNKEGMGINPHVEDESLRLLAARHMLELSKQGNAISSPGRSQPGRFGSSSHVKFPGVDPMCAEQRHQLNLASKKDVSEIVLKPPQSSATHRMGGDIDKVDPMTGLNNWCNHSTSMHGNSLHSKDVDMQGQYSRHPFSNEHPPLRLGRSESIIQSNEHGQSSQKISNTCFPGNCSCAVRTKCLGGGCDYKFGISSNAFKEQIGSVGCCEGSMSLTSNIDKDYTVHKEKTFFLEKDGKMDVHMPAKINCHAFQWKDVPNKVVGICNKTHLDKPTTALDGRENDVHQLDDSAGKSLKRTEQEVNTMKGKEMSNISSGCSAPAVTQGSIDVNNTDSCTVDEEDAKYVNNVVVDEGSVVDKCWSSDDVLCSERSAEFLGSTYKSNFLNDRSSKALGHQSPCNLIDEIKMLDSLRWKNGRNQIQTTPTSYDKTNHLQKVESGPKSGKRKRDIKWKMLDSSFPASGISSVNNGSSTHMGGARLQWHSPPCNDKEVLLSDQETSDSFDTAFAGPNWHQRSSLSSTKTSFLKRDLHRVYNHNTEEEDGYETDHADFLDVPHVSRVKRFRQDWPPHASKELCLQKPNYNDSVAAAKFISVDSTKAVSSWKTNNFNRKERPVVCGKYGIISNGITVLDISKPAKIVSLSSILKTARRCTLSENCGPRSTSIKKLKNKRSKGKNKLFDEFSGLKERDSEKHNATDELDHDVMENTCLNGDKEHAGELSRLEKERDDGRVKLRCISDSYRSTGSKSKPKEIRKRSLCELIVKGNDSTCGPQKKCRSLGKFESTAGNSVCQNGEQCDVSAKEPITNESFISKPDAFCCVCGGSNKHEINCLLECSQCFIRVHQACYGVAKVPKGHWYCRPCRTSSKHIACVLCGYGGGAMTRALRSHDIVKSLLKAWNIETECRAKNELHSSEAFNNELSISSSPKSELKGDLFPVIRPVNIEASSTAASVVGKLDMQKQPEMLQKLPGSSSKLRNSITVGILDPTVKQWVHMVCGLWTPGTRCPNVDTMSAFDVSGASCPRASVVCSICNRSGGSFIQCRVVNCFVQFHPWCAHEKGLLQSEVEGVDNECVGFYGRCVLHAACPPSKIFKEPLDCETDSPKEKGLSCARTEGYKGRKRDGFRHINFCQSNGNAGCLVPQEQLDAWVHINGKKPYTERLSKQSVSEIEHDCRKEYARYKQAKGWKQLVVYKSGIHALGLYTSQFIYRGAMVVEYVGEIVGLRVADKREIEYQSGRKLQYKSACYFFRIDKEHIIDATCKGGIARFVNHSCLPNCVAKVICVRNVKKVVFFAERDIFPGEEITYDYHFNHEDEGKKIPCFCNSKNCRRYLN